MSLIALIIFWDGEEILPHTVRNISPLVDEVLIVYSNYSNYGQLKPNQKFVSDLCYGNVKAWHVEPQARFSPRDNETLKRNIALDEARRRCHDYFLMMDADELYEAEPFKKEYERIKKDGLTGLVCGSMVYFGKPNLTIGMDTTRVPFIHKLTSYARFGMNKNYPFAFEKREIRIDPTRQLNFRNGIEWSQIVMHHYSWVRKDADSKIKNSSARVNIERSTILKDFLQAKEGYYCEYYRKTLVTSQVDFGI